MPAIRAVCALVALTLVAGCRDDGRTLDPAPTVPVSRETTTTSGPNPDDGGSGTQLGGLTLTSPAFVDGAALDEDFTCDGANVPPPLVIGDVPQGTAELAIVVTDRDAGGFVHWAVAGLPPAVTALESGLIPPEAIPARTDSGVEGWDGPCPPPGDDAHTYDFVVYATLEPIGLSPGVDGRDAVTLIEKAAVASGAITATYAS